MHMNIPASRGGVGATDSSSMEVIMYSMAVWLIAMTLSYSSSLVLDLTFLDC